MIIYAAVLNIFSKLSHFCHNFPASDLRSHGQALYPLTQTYEGASETDEHHKVQFIHHASWTNGPTGEQKMLVVPVWYCYRADIATCQHILCTKSVFMIIRTVMSWFKSPK